MLVIAMWCYSFQRNLDSRWTPPNSASVSIYKVSQLGLKTLIFHYITSYFQFTLVIVYSPSKTLIATTIPSLTSTLSSLGLKNTSAFGNSFRTPLWTLPKAPRPSSSIKVTRAGGISFDRRWTMSDFLLKEESKKKIILPVKRGWHKRRIPRAPW